MIKKILIASFLCAFTLLSFAQDTSMDSLFDEPIEDIVAPPVSDARQIDHTRQFTEAAKPVFSGSFSSEGGAGLGWVDFPSFSNPREGLSANIGAEATTTLKLDARPDPAFRLYGNTSVDLKPSDGQYTWSAFAIDELFVDYSGIPNAFFRVGKHTISWGQGRLFTPGNPMSGSEEGSAFRASFPTVLSGLSAVALAQNSYFADPASPSYREIAFGAIADEVLLGSLVSTAFRYRGAEGFQGLFSLKRTILSTDLLCDIVYRKSETSRNFALLAGFFREWKDFKLYGEYQYEGATPGGRDHSFGLAAGLNNVFGTTFDVGSQWLHTLQDDSGSLTLGLTWNPWSHIKASVAVPLTYGKDGSRYILDNEDPSKRRLALILLLELSGSF
ncbi:hypothetical protein MASR2M78_31790 [Treponema sp.]